MIVLNLVIGVIMNSMDETNSEMALGGPTSAATTQTLRDGIDDLHKRMEELAAEMKVVKALLREDGQVLNESAAFKLGYSLLGIGHLPFPGPPHYEVSPAGKMATPLSPFPQRAALGGDSA